jgi:hypothetical protein
VREYYETINIVFIHELRLWGTCESLGLYASKIKYQKDGIEYEETLDNEEFTVMEEIVIEHQEEDN